jgi:hypothetical protein
MHAGKALMLAKVAKVKKGKAYLPAISKMMPLAPAAVMAALLTTHFTVIQTWSMVTGELKVRYQGRVRHEQFKKLMGKSIEEATEE